MKNSRIITIGGLILAMMISLNAGVYAQKGSAKSNGPKDGDKPEFFCKNIPDLTEEQQEKIDALRTTQMKAMQSFHNQLAEKGAHLQTLRTADKVDMDAINKTIDEMGAIRTKMMKSREQHIQDVRSLLTDKQRVYFDNFKKGNGPGQGCCYGKGPGKGYGYGKGQCKGNWQN